MLAVALTSWTVSIYIVVERDTQLGPGSTKLTPNGSILKIAPAE